jgi:cobalt/nickel transport system permease protein
MSPVHRAPAALKLGVSLGLILGLAALPAERTLWGLCALLPLLAVALLARLQLRPLLSRLALGVPFLLSVASLALFQPNGLRASAGVLARSATCLLTLQLLASTTPIGELVQTLRRLHLPELLCDAVVLLARYSSLLIDEAQRMRRARAGRTLRASRWLLWRAMANSIGLLFVRTVSRAERVQVAMRARGGG